MNNTLPRSSRDLLELDGKSLMSKEIGVVEYETLVILVRVSYLSIEMELFTVNAESWYALL